MTVHVLATGGTIASHFDGRAWTEIDGGRLVAELGDLPVEVSVADVAAGPSSSLSSDDMVAIARRIEGAIELGAQGVVVLHGTDTMELTAFMAQLLLGTTPERPPVVFTGSMRAHSHPAPDGPTNLRDAITVAADSSSVGRDVMVCIGGELHAADRVRKRDAVSLDAFTSSPFEPIGHVGAGAVTYVATSAPRRAARAIATDVPLVTCHPGISADAVAAARNAAGIVIEGFGDLNVPRSIWQPIHEAWHAGTLVVIASSAFTPNRGDDELRALGAVGAGGLSAQRARLAVMAALASTSTRDEAIEFLHQYALDDARERITTP